MHWLAVSSISDPRQTRSCAALVHLLHFTDDLKAGEVACYLECVHVWDLIDGRCIWVGVRVVGVQMVHISQQEEPVCLHQRGHLSKHSTVWEAN